MEERAVTIETENLESYEEALKATFRRISEEKVVERIWNKDYTLWKDEDREISNRLGWLSSPQDMVSCLPEIEKFAQEIKNDGYTQALLLGMGGSSLAPEVLSRVFGTTQSDLKLEILDSTVPATILTFKNKLDPRKTLFIVSSKSGTTVETVSLFKFFFNWVYESLVKERAGDHFIAITDPGTPLELLARQHHFRSIFFGDTEVGGRFSAFSPFDLVPAALTGVEVRKLLEKGQEMARLCLLSSPLQKNPAAFLGTILSLMAQSGRDKVTFILSPRIESFASWLEQLLAESTGKEGKGIVPVARIDNSALDSYGNDRLFIHISLEQDMTHYHLINALKKVKHPYLRLSLQDVYSLGGQFFLWEMATAITGFLLKINPFDQPNVARSKKKAQEFIVDFREKKSLPPETPALSDKNLSLFADFPATSIKESLKAFLRQAQEGDYVAILAFLQPTAKSEKYLQELKSRIQKKTKLAVTTGFGPRYLHSTGQLHKGDRGNGLFIQLTAEDAEDALIPDEPCSPYSSLSFGILKKAQERGDWEALREAKRRVIRFHLHQEISKGLEKIISLL